jgi:hypothetical protein
LAFSTGDIQKTLSSPDIFRIPWLSHYRQSDAMMGTRFFLDDGCPVLSPVLSVSFTFMGVRFFLPLLSPSWVSGSFFLHGCPVLSMLLSHGCPLLSPSWVSGSFCSSRVSGSFWLSPRREGSCSKTPMGFC